jgi:hypothetical protein
MVYLNVENDSAGHLMGVAASNISQSMCLVKSSTSTALIAMAVNQVTYLGDAYFSNVAPELNITRPVGFFLGTLDGSNEAIRVNGSEVTSATETNTSSRAANNILVGEGAAFNPNRVDGTFTAWSTGGALTTQQRADYYTHIQAYMEAMGWEA